MRATMTLCALFCLAGVPGVYADSWAAPQPQSYSSKDGAFRLTVTPAELGAKNAKCKGKLEKQVKKGQYELVWEADLSNRVAPVSALVSADGKHVVTFDNWHSVGRGDNVVVIYGQAGKLIKKLAVSDFVDAALERRLPISVSSTWWGSGHELDEKAGAVVLKVGKHKSGFDGKPIKECEVRVSLKDGKLLGSKASEIPPAKKP